MKELIEQEITQEEANKLWNRIFGEEDSAEFSGFSDEEFDSLVKILEGVKTPIDWEADKLTRKILLWKPHNPKILLKEYSAIILLLSCMKGAARKWLENGS